MAKRGLKANGKLKPGCTFMKGGKVVCGPKAKRILARRRKKAAGVPRRRQRAAKRGRRSSAFCQRCNEYC